MPNFSPSPNDTNIKYLFRLFCLFRVSTQYMIEQGALTINGIQDIAATTIQKCWRGYELRKGFKDRKNLLVKHFNNIRKRASAAEQRRTEDLLGNQSVRSVSPRYNLRP